MDPSKYKLQFYNGDLQPADNSAAEPDSSRVINPFEENVESLKPKRKKNN